MKKTFLLFITCSFLTISAQEHTCAKHKQHALVNRMDHEQRTATLSPQISHELKYDIKFVNLNLNMERNNLSVSGNVKTIASVIAPLDTFQTLLHQNYTIDSIRINGALLPSMRQDSLIKVAIPAPLLTGSSFTTIVYYNGVAPTNSAALVPTNGYNNGTNYGNQVCWTSSESFLAYHWWPCKQILTDKIDSSWVFVTTDSSNKVGSNGLLKNVVALGNKKRYEWKSRTPIDYYLISVAISQYTEYNLYAHPMYYPNDSILIQNYVFNNAFVNPSWIAIQKVQLNKTPAIIEFLSKIYGMYPFYKEKYGHSMTLDFMENQTMTSIGSFDFNSIVHELAHQWWGDNVTCKSWGDITINEGFAVYTELLVNQYLNNAAFANLLMTNHNFVMNQPGGSIYFTDTMNVSRIFDNRLTYCKPASILHTLRFVTNNDSLWFNTLRSFQNSFAHKTASVMDFKTHYESQTTTNATQFFNQWYFGEGYPIFHTYYNQVGNTVFIKSTQTTSKPSSVPLFITPMEYKITRGGAPDTVVRVMHSDTTEYYSFKLLGTVTRVYSDPNDWLINYELGPTKDTTLVAGLNAIKIDPVEIELRPNPTKGIINFTNNTLNAYRLVLGDLSGKLILEKTLDSATSIDLSAFASEIYIIRVIDSSGRVVQSKKIVKQ